MGNNSLQYFTIITSTKSEKSIIKLLNENCAHVIEIIYGHGSATKGVLAQAFGFDTEEKKLLITCLVPTNVAKNLIDILYDEYNFNKPNTGIAFSMKVEGLLF